MTVYRTKDVSLVDGILHHQDVFAGISDDSTPKEASASSQIQDDANVFLAVEDGGKVVGCFVFLGHGDECEIHTCLTKACRGAKAREALKLALNEMFSSMGIKAVVGYCLSSAKSALYFIRTAGWSFVGRQPHPTTVNGQKVDELWFSITRSQWESQLK